MTDKPLSRQRIYQLRRIADGLCGYCGRRTIELGERCKVCIRKNIRRNKANYKRRKKERVLK